MFTGIITDVGRVRAVVPGGDTRFEIATAFDTAAIAIGASIACSGPCLTVVEKGPGWFAVDASAETLSRTTLGTWREGTRVNLERALRLGDELGGHLVSGHVDGVAEVTGRRSEGDSLRLSFRPPAELMPFIAGKGSATIEGVSLTVNEVEGDRFGVNLIPHTQTETTLGSLAPGDRVNMEIDMLARYVARLMENGQTWRRT
ncbi:MAG: riboflavin synthase [Alphaproteobacteria bacterium]